MQVPAFCSRPELCVHKLLICAHTHVCLPVHVLQPLSDPLTQRRLHSEEAAAL